jgi:hypothetical protein
MAQVGGRQRAGAVSLADASRAATDFVLLRVVGDGALRLFRRFNFRDVENLCDLLWAVGPHLLAVNPAGLLVVYDDVYRPRLELEVATEAGYRSRSGEELPAAGLRLLRFWMAEGAELREQDLRSAPIRLPLLPELS